MISDVPDPHIRKTKGTNTDLSSTKVTSLYLVTASVATDKCINYSLLESDFMVCGTQVPPNIGTLSNNHHITYAVRWLPKYTNTKILNTGSNETRSGHIGVFLTEQTWFTIIQNC